ncbi:CRISPR-associated protein cas1 [Secundilactobacillus paracollinoides DSM 15502 = JCM 11969]|nr:CRISPR-associated protein cas1 [Secundilactobacillus paracollinoides DSM 15502 = JCM 11969]
MIYLAWRTIIVSRHAKISLSANNIVIQTDQDRFHVPVSDIDVLMLSTLQGVITTAAINALNRGQAVIIFIDESGNPSCDIQTTSSPRRNAHRITQQVNWIKERVERLWTLIVTSKIKNQLAVCEHLDCPNLIIETALNEIEINDVSNREAVAARAYFPAIFGKGFSRDELNEKNAALNYGYAIIHSLINREITIRGNMTCIGIHHDRTDNQYNLGSDLMEPFRPIIDQWVATHKFNEFTPDIKYGLVDLLNLELVFNGKKGLLRNIIGDYVNDCLRFLNQEINHINVEVTIPNEVSSREINGFI